MSSAPNDKKKKEAQPKAVKVDPRAMVALARSMRDGVIKVDEKTHAVKSPSFSIITDEGVSLKDQMRMMGVSRKPVRTKLVYSFSQTSAAGAALNFAQRLRPSDSSEFASFAALYDEYKCHGALILFHTALSASITSNLDLAACYDVTSTSLSAISDAIVAEQHFYCNSGNSVSGNITAFPLAVTKDGHWRHRIRIPKGVVASSGAVIDGAWVDTASTTTDFGFWKGISTAPGGAVTYSVGGHIVFDMEFRMRS